MGQPPIEVFDADAAGFDDSSGIRSMLSRDERGLSREVARRHYRGRGAVIELGTWLGSGTFEICRGLDGTGRPWRLRAMDRFGWTAEHARKHPEANLAPGDSFLPRFLANMGPYAGRVAAVRGDLADLGRLMPLDGPAELLFVDAPKSWRMLWRVLDHLGPRLAPGGRVVLQDFFHISSRQIIWLTARLPQLSLAAVSRTGTTAVFAVAGPVADLAAAAPRDFAALSADDLLALWPRLKAGLPAPRLGEVAVGLALDLLDRGAAGPAAAVLREGVEGGGVDGEEGVDGGLDGGAALREVQRLVRINNKEAPKLRRVAAFLEQGRPLDAAS
jgi:predicted O-methyltransferase YrrM